MLFKLLWAAIKGRTVTKILLVVNILTMFVHLIAYRDVFNTLGMVVSGVSVVVLLIVLTGENNDVGT